MGPPQIETARGPAPVQTLDPRGKRSPHLRADPLRVGVNAPLSLNPRTKKTCLLCCMYIGLYYLCPYRSTLQLALSQLMCRLFECIFVVLLVIIWFDVDFVDRRRWRRVHFLIDRWSVWLILLRCYYVGVCFCSYLRFSFVCYLSAL